MKKILILLPVLILSFTACNTGVDVAVNGDEDSVDEVREEVVVDDLGAQDVDCVELGDLPDKYGCHPSMFCDEGEVCRDGLCVDATDAPDEYGCHPSMLCDEGEVCRDGLCVDAADAPDEYGCHPSMLCDEGEVCRDGLCYLICK